MSKKFWNELNRTAVGVSVGSTVGVVGCMLVSSPVPLMTLVQIVAFQMGLLVILWTLLCLLDLS